MCRAWYGSPASCARLSLQTLCSCCNEAIILYLQKHPVPLPPLTSLTFENKITRNTTDLPCCSCRRTGHGAGGCAKRSSRPFDPTHTERKGIVPPPVPPNPVIKSCPPLVTAYILHETHLYPGSPDKPRAAPGRRLTVVPAVGSHQRVHSGVCSGCCRLRRRPGHPQG